MTPCRMDGGWGNQTKCSSMRACRANVQTRKTHARQPHNRKAHPPPTSQRSACSACLPRRECARACVRQCVHEAGAPAQRERLSPARPSPQSRPASPHTTAACQHARRCSVHALHSTWAATRSGGVRSQPANSAPGGARGTAHEGGVQTRSSRAPVPCGELRQVRGYNTNQHSESCALCQVRGYVFPSAAA